MLERITKRKNWPIVKTNIAVSAPVVIVVLLQVYYFRGLLAWNFYAKIWFIIGLMYTHFFEYGHHRWPMHMLIVIAKTGSAILDKTIIFVNKILRAIRQSHKIHHRRFSITNRGNNLQSDSKEDLQHITGPWWFFPATFFLHYLFLLPIMLAHIMSINSVTFFAIGTAVHYLIYEDPHFLAHSKDNKIDKFVFKIPILGPIRQWWINYHLYGHHCDPQANYSVTPPWLDWLFGTKSRKKVNPA